MNPIIFKVTVNDDGRDRSFAIAAVNPMDAREKAQALGWQVADQTIFQIETSAVTGGSVHMIKPKGES